MSHKSSNTVKNTLKYKDNTCYSAIFFHIHCFYGAGDGNRLLSHIPGKHSTELCSIPTTATSFATLEKKLSVFAHTRQFNVFFYGCKTNPSNG